MPNVRIECRNLVQNMEKKGLKRRAEAAVESAAPALLENANSSYAIPEHHHRSYGEHASVCSSKSALGIKYVEQQMHTHIATLYASI